MTDDNPNDNSDHNEDAVEQRFESLYPNYDYSLESSYNEKDARKRKRMKTMYWYHWLLWELRTKFTGI